MIQIKNLSKSFDGFKALDAVDVHVPDGSVYGLVGPNGAGKSTLIRHMAGIYRGDSGEISYDGESVYENPAVKEKIAYIADEVSYFAGASVRDMAELYKSVYPSFSVERYKALSELFGISDKLLMRKLSKGMRRQIAFGLALSIYPSYLLLDEPLDGLDPVMRRQILKLVLSDVEERGMTVLVSSHNLRELEDLCDRVGIMTKGKMLLERSLCELQENTVKIQLALPEGKTLPEGLDILHEDISGRLHRLIIRGRADETEAILKSCEPFFMDALPLSLEEVFIYELGGAELEK